MPNKLDALYSEVSKTYDVGSIQDFQKYLSDPKKRQLFFKEVVAPEYEVGSIDEFEETYGFKKKNTESPGQPKAKDAFSVSGETQKAGPSAPSVRKRYDVKGKPQPEVTVKPTAQLTQRDYELMMPFMGTPDAIATVVGDAPIEQPNPFAEDVKRAGEILTKKSPEGDAFTAGIITSKPETKQYAKEVLAAVQGPEAPSYIEKIVYGSVASGNLADKIATINEKTNADDIDFEEIASLNKIIQDNAIEDEGGVVGFLKYLPTVLASSLISMGAADKSAIAGAGAGAVTGSVFPVVGTAAGAAAGFAGASSLALEYSSSLMGALRDAGVDITNEEDLKSAFLNPEKIQEAKSYAIKRGMPVAVFDMVSGGLAGKIGKTAAKATAKEILKAGAKETAVQATLGGAGEATAQILADGELDGRQIAYEMIAEPASAIPSAAINYLGDKARTAAEKRYVKRIETDANLKLKSDIATIVDPEIASSSKKINEYRKLKEEAVSQTAKDEYDRRISEEREKKYSAYEKFFPVFDSLSEEKKQEAYNALDEVGRVKDEYNAAESPEEKKILGQVLAQKINKLKEYAVQEQTTSQVPVQPETRTGEEVVEGKPQPEPQVAAEEGQDQEEVKNVVKKLNDYEINNPRYDERIGDSGAYKELGGLTDLENAALELDKKPSITTPGKIEFLPETISLTHLTRNENDLNSILKNGFDVEQVNLDSPIPGVYFSSEDWSSETMDRFDREKQNALYTQIKNDGLLYFDSVKDLTSFLKENNLPVGGRGLNKEQINSLKSRGIKGIVLRQDYASSSRNELIVIDQSIIQSTKKYEGEKITDLPSSFSSTESIANAYTKYKSNGENPEFVKKVESILKKQGESKTAVKEEVIPGEKAVVSGIEITYPTEQEKTERQKVRNSKEYVSAKAFELPVITDEEFQGDIEGEFAMVTAENPKAQPLTEEENVALNTKAEQWLIDKGYYPKKIVGKYDQAENSFFVKGMTKEDAFEFAKEFNQESVAHSDGMIYQNGKMNPRNKAKDNFETKNFVPGDNVVSIINTPEGPKTFSVGYDFEIDTDFAPKTNFEEAVNKSAQSLNMVAPGLKIIIAENTDDAQMQIAEALSAVAPSQAGEVAGGFTTETRGQTVFVNGKPFAMVFNKESADSTTVGHEAWEILLNDAFADDQARMKEFVDSIDAQLRAQGFEEIADKLDAFASQRGYEDVKYSEYMAELGGMLVASGFGKGSLTAQQKTLLQKIGYIINKFAQLFTGKKQFLDQATPEDILGFMTTISEKVSKGEDVASFLRPKETKATGVEAKSQKQAIEILDGPKFESKLKEDVASYLNSLRDSEIPPNSTREELMERFINNVYEEVGYYLYSKPDARSAGLTWYIEDMVEFANKVKVVLPELSDENQYKLFLTVLAFTSSGTNPNQNLLYAYNLWNNSKNPSNFEFSKTWGDSKLSFIDKKGKSIASGVIAKETAKEYTVELIDSLGRPVVDKKGNKKYEKIAKSSMKEGYPKPTGYTNRGEIIIGQLEKLEKIYKDLGSIDKVVKWLETPHPIAELRKYNQSVPDVNGKGPGKTNKEYDPNKNADGERNGAFVFGEKIGSFYQNMIGIGETITMDLWWSRTWNRYMGTMINTVSGKKEIQEVPRSDRERNIMREAVKLVAEDLNLQVSELQAAIWYFEQELWTKSGNESPSYSYVTAIDDLTKKLKVDEETRTKLRAAEADLSEAEKRRQNAAERAAAVVASKGGEIPVAKVTAKSQKSVPPVVDEVLTDDGKGNYVFVHYSDEKRDTIKPMSGSKKNFTGREEVAAISSVGGVAMYYTKQGQVESGVGDVPHTVLVPKDKVYFYGTTERGKVLNDPDNFEPEARRRFQEYKNRGNETRPTTYAFDSNNAAAWVTKVAAENGYDMVVTNWGGPKSYRAQTVKELTPEADYTGFKEIPDDVFEIGDEVFVYKRYGKITDIEGDVLTIDTENAFGNFDRSKFQLTKFTRDRILLIEKAKPSVTTRSQKVDVTVIPGYERMMGEVEGIIEKTLKKGKSYNQVSAAAIGYIQQSAVYERADDSQREQIIRDFKKIRGEKMKAAPSVARIMGEIKDTKEVTVKEKTALKDQIKLEAKAAKDAVAYVKELRTQISTALRAMTGRGVISARQATTILARYDKMNILNPVMRDRFVDYMSNVLQRAEYLDKIREASKLRKAIKKASKSADNQAEVSKMAKDFASIDPSRVEDIDQYIENATQVLNSAARKTGDPLMRNPVNMANMANYIEQEIEIQNEQIKNEILSKYQELVDAGVLSSDMTINEIKRVVAAIEENDSDAQAKVAKAKEALKGMMEEISPVIMQMVRTGEDPFTGEPIEITYEEKKALKSLTEMDLDNLSLADAVKVVEYANNFVANGITSGIVGMTELYNGSLEPGKLVKKGFKSIPIRKYFMKGAGKVWAEGFATLPMLNKLYWGDTRRAIEVSEASGVTGISNGKAKAIKIVDKAVKEYIAKFAKTKDFLASENVLERGMLAFMSRGVVGDEFQVQDEYNRRKTLIEETIQALKDPENSTDLEIAKGEVAQKVYDKILKGSKNAEEVRSKASKTNVDAVDWWINEWSKHYDQMDEVSRNVYNTLLSRDSNYTPDRFQLKEAPTATEEDFESSFFGNFEYVDTSKSGSLRQNNRITNLPEDKNGVKKRIVNLDFDVNNVNALTSALIDVETAGSVMKAKGFVTSKDFSKLFSSKEDRDLYKKRIIKYVSRVKGGSYVDQNELAKMNKVINAIASFGVAKALFSLSQPLKQFVPPMLNTLAQTGRFDIAELFKGGMEFIDNSGYPIANRGVGSQGELKSINRKLVEAEKNLALRGLDGVADFSNAALELTLKNPDIYAARASWISFYMSELKKQGIKPSSINWSTHKLNKQAADYAQSMVDSQQNISDTDMQGEIFASKQPATVFLRRALLPLMTFTLNQKTRIWADIRTIGNEVSSKEDKLEAKKSLAGALVELTAFSAISFGVKELLYMTAQAIFGVEEDDEEEEKKKRMMRQSASTAQNFLRDFFLPPIPGMDAVASGGVNMLLEESGLSETIPQKWFNIEDESARFNLYDKQNQGYLDMLGTQGIAAEKALELAGYYDMAIDGKFTKEYNGNKVEKQVLEEDRKAAALNALVMSGYYGGLLPSDIAYIVGIINKKIQKRAETAEEED